MNGYRFDERGNVVPTKVYIVYGAPASGKTSYVRRHKVEGDLVVDLDSIKRALSLDDRVVPESLVKIAISVRDHLYDLISLKRVSCHSVWVIGCLPHRNQRNDLRRRLNAELVFIDESEQACIERAMNDPTRTDKELQKQIIGQWFQDYRV
jgi:predicted kinase